MNKTDGLGISFPMVTPTKDKRAKGIEVSTDVDDDTSGKEAMANEIAETDKEMADMTTDDNPT